MLPCYHVLMHCIHFQMFHVASLLHTEKVRISKFVHGPAITLKIITSDLPFEVRVDLAPMCDAELPFASMTDWPRRETKWPPEDKIKVIKAAEISAVAKKDFTWTLSFAECERELIINMDANEGVRTKCHMIMKSVREEFWCPYGMKQVLTSYDLKVCKLFVLARHLRITLLRR